VSENDYSHCALCTGTAKTEVTSHGKECLKRKAFKLARKTSMKTGIDGVDMTRVVQEEEQLSWLLGMPSGPKIAVDRFF